LFYNPFFQDLSHDNDSRAAFYRTDDSGSLTGAVDPLLAENSYYLEWGGDDGRRQRRWREFLMREDP
jgi:hypothetical protein